MLRALVPAVLLVAAVPAAAATGPGALDPTFSGDGRAYVDFGANHVDETARDVVIRSDGRVVVVGDVGDEAAGTTRWAVARLREDGRPDPRFSGNGRTLTPIGTSDRADVALLTGGGRVLVGGTSDGRFALVAYTRSGRLDDRWGGDGIVTTDIPAGAADVLDLRSGPDGAVLAAGTAGPGAAVVRYLADGTPDPGFGTAGIVTTPAFSGGIAGSGVGAVALTPGGGLLVSGSSGWNGDGIGGIRVERYDAAGLPVTGFGDAGGVTVYGDDAEAGRGQAVLLQPDGKVLVGGSFFGPGDYRYFAVLRFTAAGVPDPDFGAGRGQVTGLLDCCYAEVADLALQGNGKIVVAGWTTGDNDPPRMFIVGRLLPSGAGDPDFGGRFAPGVRGYGFGSETWSEATSVAVGGGRMVAAGWFGYDARTARFAVLRLRS